MQLAEHIEKLFALPQWAAAILGDFVARNRWRTAGGMTAEEYDANRIYGGRHRHGTIDR
jgi:hypothetical protein